MLKKYCLLIVFCVAVFFGKAQVVNRFDIVIDELMADPTPQINLPNNEWIELRNTTATTINLLGWRIADATGISGPMPSYNLLPDSFIIVCTASAVAAMSAYGPTIAVTSFPSLDNTGDIIYLRSPQNKIIHTVNYTDAWYQNELKKDGGWTLEMIDTKNPCSGFSNWKASIDLKGGTPGKKNSVDAINADATAPQLLRAFATDSVNIVLVFDEPVDSVKAASVNNYSVSDSIGVPQQAITVSPAFDKVNLKLNAPLSRNKIYTVTATAITDCAGNSIAAKNIARVGLTEIADSLNIVINEILFNPKSNGADYVEIYNRSNKIIDLKQTYIANRSSAGIISNIKQLSADNYLLFPQDFIVITEDAAIIKRDFITKNMDAFVTVASMPSFNDDKGNVIILNAQGNITDELEYDEKWHFKLIENREGVALERIDYNAPTQQSDNWHSAATSAGYGTPTYKNSQYKINDGVQGEIKITPEIVSPDNDGIDDFATIDYSFPSPGYVASIIIFDAAGRVVRNLQRNALCGIKGNFRWDGLGEKNQKLSMGIYIIYTEIFNLEGKKKQFKNTIVLARR
jgi:Lamin Tail Domain/Bacterial Ig-like domain